MTVFRLDLKRNIGEVVSWTILISACIAIMMFLHSMFGNIFNPESFSSRVDALPGVIRGVLGLNGSPDLSQPMAFAAYIFQFVMLLSGIYACTLGARSLAGEESKGTIEFLYGLPITRGSILRQKLFCGIFRYWIYCTIVYTITCMMIWLLNREMNISGVVIELIRVYVCLLFSGLVYMSLGILLSSLFRSNAESISVALAFVLITYIIGMMGCILSHLKFLCYLSPVHAMLPLNAMNNGFSIIGLGIGAFTFIIALVLAMIRYNSKDFLI